MVVLGYDWLNHHNPWINWVETKIMLTPQKNTPVIEKQTEKLTHHEKPHTNELKTNIQLVSTRGLWRLCHQQGAKLFSVNFDADNIPLTARAAEPLTDSTQQPEPQSGIPPKYHKLSDAFSGEKADTLTLHCLTTSISIWKKA